MLISPRKQPLSNQTKPPEDARRDAHTTAGSKEAGVEAVRYSPEAPLSSQLLGSCYQFQDVAVHRHLRLIKLETPRDAAIRWTTKGPRYPIYYGQTIAMISSPVGASCYVDDEGYFEFQIEP